MAVIDKAKLPPISIAITSTTTDSLGNPVVNFTPTWYQALSDLVNLANNTAASTGAAGGDLSGTYPNPTVAKINGVALGSISNTAGRVLLGNGTTINSVALSGALTLNGSGVATLSASGVTPGSYTVNGSVMFTVGTDGRVTVANNVTVTPSGSAGGSLTGTYPNPSLASNSVNTTQIINSAVTYAKLQNETDQTLLGNNSGGAAAPSEITLGTGLGWSGSSIINTVPAFTSPLTTKGDIFVYSTTNDRLPVSTNGYVLSCDSTQSSGLKWVPQSGGGGSASIARTFMLMGA